MASGLEDVRKRLKLTCEEEEIAVFEDEIPAEKIAEIKLCLWGKLLTNKQFNARAIKSILQNIWKPEKGIVSFDGAILLLKDIDGTEQLSEVKFETARFWVKAYDVSAMQQTYAFACFLTSKVRSFVSCKEATMYGVDKSLCFTVDIDISKPLKRGQKVMVGGKPMLVDFRYVKLPNFCYLCGMLGHVTKGCGYYNLDVLEYEYQYGNWLRASPLKS
ncbi:hypothetical protein Cgig2_015809 [Carnegiea gigantea]|uniref:CCHC-type domain-containing protein n=1 Tax=Carnegiea gigantea TaxID=171969 RepID=A0A9Q1KI94_9CARY|nr:hypothetical protein Cgig2_015809 [Carnegiea gigantea]